MSAQDLTQQGKREILFDALTPKKLELILLPTEHCNFRCLYCYEDFAIGRMSQDVVAGIKALLTARAPGLDQLSLSWFGGEPLIAYNVVTDICRHALDCARSNGVRFSCAMTTNGYGLTAERMVELHELALTDYQISLDGDRDAHDKTRRRIDGAGTFDKIWSNLLVFNDLALTGVLGASKVLLRLHVHPENVESVDSLARRIREELSPSCFSIFVSRVWTTQGTKKNALRLFDRQTDDEYHSVLKNVHTLLAAYEGTSDKEGVDVCYASKANSLLIRADGRIGKCTVALSDDSNTVGRINTDGTLSIDSDRLAPWLHGLTSMNLADLACPLHHLPRANRAIESRQAQVD